MDRDAPYLCMGRDAHFDPMDIRSLAGWRSKAITCMTPVIDPVYNNPDGEFYVKIWKGEGPDLELMHQQRVENPVGGKFQEVVLDEDVFVEEGQGLWIGLYVDYSEGPIPVISLMNSGSAPASRIFLAMVLFLAASPFSYPSSKPSSRPT